MPTSTFTITANANDGRARAFFNLSPSTSTTGILQSGANSPQLYSKYYPGYISRSGGWVRITGITIPQGSTINSATLNIYAQNQLHSARTYTNLVVEVDSRQSPGNPASGKAVIQPQNTTGKVTLTTTYDTAQPWNLKPFNVTSFVQNLVDNYGYSSGEMVFYVGLNHSYAMWYTMYASVRIYNRDKGTSQAAELVVDFTPPAGPPPDRTTYHHR
jgi:hypothetical protein